MQNAFAQNLGEWMRRTGWGSAELAATVEIATESLEEMLEGATEPSLDELMRIAHALGCSLDRLVMPAAPFIRRHDIKLLLLDVDGTLTDGSLGYDEQGNQVKFFNVKDGLAMSRAIRRGGLQIGFITNTSRPASVQARANDLGVQHFYAGSSPKIEILTQWLKELHLSPEEVAFCGDDLNDIDLMRVCGLSACPADAVPQIRKAAQVVLNATGGHGCVRELIEDVLGYDLEALSARGKTH